jgi:hypothetical protein
MDPLTARSLQSIVEKWAGNEAAYDIGRLCQEIDRQADLLSDCWLFIDSLAESVPGAAELLRKQQVTGWKGRI